MKKSPLGRASGLILDGLSVVFAVLVALAVDEWNEERELREQADRARTAVISELVANREELAVGIESSQEMLEGASQTLGILRRGDEQPDSPFEGSLPDFSDAAWETARVTGIVSHMDYEWVLETARVYETQDLILGLQGDLLALFGRMVARLPEEERFADLVGQLALLNSMQTQLGAKIDTLLAHTLGAEFRGDTLVFSPPPADSGTEGGR